ncbi:Fpg/Nei family DNA glycosylase [Nesterenkonia xinjiangensis]|uniref:DNA-(apurinic or apyrimidinic site) lyase n=1 Tax=Nesterenkonia xinjiangensis TaxID=225327 RepID=A0A7Z0GQ27_9MICC|nr:Fpg/Nei family DNA glycosylase [Nesterenkonia xinjiangensis]NYJ79599.1 endonuclease-8 [Nesterenkonia xinjiangensis]
MPEGHTLHRLARQLDRLFVGHPWRVSSPQGRFAAGAARLDGRTPERAEAWGKHLFVHVGADIWQVHLGLYGAFSFRGDEEFSGAATLGAPRTAAEPVEAHYDDAGWIVPAAPAGAVRARIHVRHGWADLRGPATCAVLDVPDYERVITRLGPDPLRQPAEVLSEQAAGDFAARLARRRIPIAAALMDQSVIAGVGNIYRAESLFLEQMDPQTPAQRLSQEAVASLWHRLTAQLRQGVAEGVIRTLRPEDAAASHDGAAGRRHWVYQHQGTSCLRCGETLAAQELQGRRLYWCPGCQR